MKYFNNRRKTWNLFLLSILLLTGGCTTTQNSNALLNYQDSFADTVYDSNAGIDIENLEIPFLSEHIVLIQTPIPSEAPSQVPVDNAEASAAPTQSPTPTGVNVSATAEYDVPLSETMTAKAALLINISDQEAIYAYHVYDQIYPASITKIMTALLAFELGNLSQTVTISDSAAHISFSGAKLCGFNSGDKIILEDLLTCMLVYSGNDSSVAVADHLAGSEEAFVQLMNEKAIELGASQTNYCNSHGLPDDNHVTTAYDTYLIMNELFHYDKFLSIISKTMYTASYQSEKGTVTKTFHSTNGYFTGTYQAPEGIKILGGKTGTTGKAGCCIALFVSAPDGKVYIAELFGAESADALYQEMNQLLEKIVGEETISN